MISGLCILRFPSFHKRFLIRSRLISFHMLHTTPQTAGIALHTTISPCMPPFHLTSLQMYSGSTLHQYFRLFISAAAPRRRHFSQLLGLASLHAVPLALSTLATTVHRTLDTRSQHSATAMAPLSTHGTCSHRFVPPTTAGLAFRPLHRSHHLMRGHIPC